VWAGAVPVVALAANQPFVGAFHEARPYTTLPGILVLAQRSADFSFPSDHAVMAGAAAAGLWLCTRSLAAVATAAALLMGLARVYIGAHYPHDVAAGLLFGALVALLDWWVLRRPLRLPPPAWQDRLVAAGADSGASLAGDGTDVMSVHARCRDGCQNLDEDRRVGGMS
jgi:membrane-associated phospholipid phosphatase